MSDARVRALRQAELFAGLDDATLMDVAERARTVQFATGARIVSELEFGADVFVVVSGHAEVSIEPRAGKRRLLGTLGPGGVVGEMASLTGSSAPRLSPRPTTSRRS
jgi:CRP-like cAMP-binding protein